MTISAYLTTPSRELSEVLAMRAAGLPASVAHSVNRVFDELAAAEQAIAAGEEPASLGRIRANAFAEIGRLIGGRV